MNKIFLSAFKIAFQALRAHKVRTGLAVLGVMIGIAAVIIVFSAGAGLDNLISSQIESFGSDIIETEIKVPSSKKGFASEQQSGINLLMGIQITTLSLDDMEDVNKLPNIENSYAAVMTQEPIVYNEEIYRTVVIATTASYVDIDRAEIEKGRFFLEVEDKALSQIAILGSGIKEKLFGESDAIGKSIKIRKTRFRVIGIMEELGAVMGMDFDDFVYIPVRTMQKKVMGIDYVHYMMHKVRDISLSDRTAEEIRFLLRENHNIPQPEEIRRDWTDTGRDDFRVVTMAEMMEIMGNVSTYLTLLLLAIVAISLVVGGVGILNVMYVIVNERTPEIGLRKAVGATYSDIMWQFLIESSLITLAGGVVGIIFGAVISYLISIGAGFYGLDWHFSIPVAAFITAIIFSIVFGILFGVYPARKAARMNPVEALGYE
ncbi:MAG: ABC transporter permease [Candidatus Paceibacterota bacterium]